MNIDALYNILKQNQGCSKHMTGNRALLTKFVKKFLGTVRFGNDDFTVIDGYGDVVIGSMTNKKVYHVEDEAPKVIISFIKKTQVNRKLQVQRVQTHNGTEFKNKTLAEFFDKEVFHEISISFQEESSSLDDDVQQSSEEVMVPSSNTQSETNDIVPNVDEASTSRNVFNEQLEDAYFDASTMFHDPFNVYTFYQPYPHEKKRVKDHPLHRITGDPKSSVRTIGDKLVCWSSRKQKCVSISTAEAEYVAVSGCCAQVLWIRTQLTDYGFFYEKVPIYFDSKSVISISCNLMVLLSSATTLIVDSKTGEALARPLLYNESCPDALPIVKSIAPFKPQSMVGFFDLMQAHFMVDLKVFDLNNALKVGYDPELEAYPPWLKWQPYSYILPTIQAPGTIISTLNEDIREKLGRIYDKIIKTTILCVKSFDAKLDALSK
nr:hypothetical protein [Tanacetum cinerariifolium]